MFYAKMRKNQKSYIFLTTTRRDEAPGGWLYAPGV